MPPLLGADRPRQSRSPVTFDGYVSGWLAGFIDDAPDRARIEAALEYRLLPVLGSRPLLEVLEADRDELERRSAEAGGDEDDGAARECLRLILEDAVEDLRAGVDQVAVHSRSMGRTWMRSSAR